MLAEGAVVGGDADTVIRFFAGLHLVDQVADGGGVGLGGTEDQKGAE